LRTRDDGRQKCRCVRIKYYYIETGFCYPKDINGYIRLEELFLLTGFSRTENTHTHTHARTHTFHAYEPSIERSPAGHFPLNRRILITFASVHRLMGLWIRTLYLLYRSTRRNEKRIIIIKIVLSFAFNFRTNWIWTNLPLATVIFSSRVFA